MRVFAYVTQSMSMPRLCSSEPSRSASCALHKADRQSCTVRVPPKRHWRQCSRRHTNCHTSQRLTTRLGAQQLHRHRRLDWQLVAHRGALAAHPVEAPAASAARAAAAAPLASKGKVEGCATRVVTAVVVLASTTREVAAAPCNPHVRMRNTVHRSM